MFELQLDSKRQNVTSTLHRVEKENNKKVLSQAILKSQDTFNSK